MASHRFGSCLPYFRNFNGRDMFRLTQNDLVAIVGRSDGTRLYNELVRVSTLIAGPSAGSLD